MVRLPSAIGMVTLRMHAKVVLLSKNAIFDIQTPLHSYLNSIAAFVKIVLLHHNTAINGHVKENEHILYVSEI